jgi:acetoacetate decarboxylase
VMVNPPGSDASGPRALQSAGAFIHHLPVDQAFTLEAGTTIWGYPKVMADFTVREGRQFGFDVSIDGQLAVGMEFRPGLAIPSAFTSRTQENPTYSYRDGVLRKTIGEMTLSGVRYRLGGVHIRLGDHPYAKELAALGLPKRAMVSASAENVEMSFGDAQEVGR